MLAFTQIMHLNDCVRYISAYEYKCGGSPAGLLTFLGITRTRANRIRIVIKPRDRVSKNARRGPTIWCVRFAGSLITAKPEALARDRRETHVERRRYIRKTRILLGSLVRPSFLSRTAAPFPLRHFSFSQKTREEGTRSRTKGMNSVRSR